MCPKNENTNCIKLGELFCGPGGIGLGAKWASVGGVTIEHVWASDCDKDACKTYERNLKPHNIICEDIRRLNLKSLNKYGIIDCLSFGFPCNDFSSIGERLGLNGSFGRLYEYCIKTLELLKPKYFIAENVSGLKNANEGVAFSKILNELKLSGYKLFPNLYQFEKYGIPQKRHRMIIIGVKNDIDVYFNIPSCNPYKYIDVSAKKALSNLPLDSYNNERTVQSPIVVERLTYIRPGENAFTANLPDRLKLNVKGAKISQIYKRLKPNEPAYTITGSGGGGTHVYHWSENRALTNRERARLQTFPDDYFFYGTKESVRKQIGMAVPPKGTKIIFESLLKSILKIPYDTMEANLKDVQ